MRVEKVGRVAKAMIWMMIGSKKILYITFLKYSFPSAFAVKAEADL